MCRLENFDSVILLKANLVSSTVLGSFIETNFLNFFTSTPNFSIALTVQTVTSFVLNVKFCVSERIPVNMHSRNSVQTLPNRSNKIAVVEGAAGLRIPALHPSKPKSSW